jgi:glutamate:GABA antiporter
MRITTESQRIENKEAELRKELGLRDLVLTQILYVVGLSWVGAAAKLGNSQIIFWLAAMILFYLPQAAVVIYLSRRFPLEGGLYQWAKLGFNNGVAFMVAWNLWVYAIVLLGAFGVQVSNAVIYAIGPSATWLSDNKIFIGAVSGGLLGALVVVSILGLWIGKWVHNIGSILLMVAFALLILLPIVGVARGTVTSYHPFAVAAPAFTLMSVNIFSKLAVGALSGFEYPAVLAGEAKDPQRTLGRSVMIAAPVIALMFILGTSSMLALVGSEHVDLVGPIPQAFRAGLGSMGGVAAVLVPFAIAAVAARMVANSSVLFTATTRMPMVAGWDNLMPAWFTRLHPKYKTPINSILFIGACSLAFGFAGILGVGQQEAFQMLDNAAGLFYGFTYAVLFAIPLFGLATSVERAPAWLRLVAIAGLATTLLYIALTVVPIVTVVSRWAYALKISTIAIGANALGAVLYLNARRGRALRREPLVERAS